VTANLPESGVGYKYPCTMSAEDRFELYEDAAGSWRWRKVAPNGEIIATGEAHTRRADAIRAARREDPEASIEVVK
jgi:uncharacterized protein YegP (UPF0339 family)